MKLLLKYIVDSFWDQLVKFEYLVSIHSLKIKYEQVFPIFIHPHFTKYNFDSRLCACFSVWRMMGRMTLLFWVTFEDDLMSVLRRKKRKTTSMRTGIYPFHIYGRRFCTTGIESPDIWLLISDEEDATSASNSHNQKVKQRQPALSNGDARSYSKLRYTCFSLYFIGLFTLDSIIFCKV